MITKERVRDQLTNIEITAWELANGNYESPGELKKDLESIARWAQVTGSTSNGRIKPRPCAPIYRVSAHGLVQTRSEKTRPQAAEARPQGQGRRD